MKALLSIKPHFADRIFSGEKLFEFRKTAFKTRDVTLVIVYSTLPVGRIIGQFNVATVLSGKPDKVWRITKQNAGIEKIEYERYFANSTTAYAIQIEKAVRYARPRRIDDVIPSGKAPQSFCYVD